MPTCKSLQSRGLADPLTISLSNSYLIESTIIGMWVWGTKTIEIPQILPIPAQEQVQQQISLNNRFPMKSLPKIC